jgi:hypothetical protein
MAHGHVSFVCAFAGSVSAGVVAVDGPTQQLALTFWNSGQALAEYPLGVSRQVHTPAADAMEISDPRASSRDQEDKRENNTDDEQDPGDVRSRSGNTAESQNARDDGDDQKYQCPVNHGDLLVRGDNGNVTF